ncbi:MAG: glycosyltransferase family 4 protein [Armatimonadetes bacterium]|nr:glycosyltransferase family 4 protein [Armatimonadota bacterium]
MKIILASHNFFPEVGGIEGMSELLAHGFVENGHEVVVVTQTPSDKEDDRFPFRVLRSPTAVQLFRAVKWCDVFFHNNISLHTTWPLAFLRRPWVVAHRTWISRVDGTLGWQDWLKRFLLRFATGISISQAIAEHISTPSTVIGNPYRDDLFFEMPEVERDRDLVFLGRLVSDKGVDLLIDALTALKSQGLTANLTIIGDGPESQPLQAQTKAQHIEDQVTFVGAKRGEELTRLLNRHRIMVVPSLWKEPFGIVALEGIACGCVIVGSEGGGLKDAIGPCGVTFANGNLEELTKALATLLRHPAQLQRYREEAPRHLASHRSGEVVKRYLHVIEKALASKSS